MKNNEQNLRSLLALSKTKAEVLIKPMELLLRVYKTIIIILVCLNLFFGGLLGYYIKINHEYNQKITKNLTYSINKCTKRCGDVERSYVEVD